MYECWGGGVSLKFEMERGDIVGGLVWEREGDRDTYTDDPADVTGCKHDISRSMHAK